MKFMTILLTFLPNIVFAGNIYWFERVSTELESVPGVTEVTYKPGTLHDSNFYFTMNGKKISAFVSTSAGHDAVYGFTKLDGSQGVVTPKDGKLEVNDGNMFDQMQALHRRGNLAAGKESRSVVTSEDGKQVELQSGVTNGDLELTIIKLKSIDEKSHDVQLSLHVSGVSSAEEGLNIIKILRPIVERQTEF